MMNFEFLRKGYEMPDQYWEYNSFGYIEGITDKYRKKFFYHSLDELEGVHVFNFLQDHKPIQGYVKFEGLILTDSIETFIEFTDFSDAGLCI